MTTKMPVKKIKIIKEAVKQFSQKGFHDVKLQAIAQNADVAKGTIYTYFKNKEALYCNCILFEADKFNVTAVKVIKSKGSFEEKLKKLIALQSSFYNKNGLLIKQFLTLGPGQLSLGDEEFKNGIKHLKQGVNILAGFFSSGVEQGILLSDLSPLKMAIVFVQAMDVNILSEFFGESKITDENMYKSIIRLFYADPVSALKKES